MIYFNNPIFFTALAAIPVLIGIYFLFRRSKPKVVSSLLLWENQLKSRKSGLVFKRLPLPLTFFLEALIIILLILAAVGFMLPRSDNTAPMTIILDNSFSMRAGSPSVRQQTISRIKELMDSFPNRETRIIMAGRTVRNLGTVKKTGKVLFHLKKWKCDDSYADLKKALALARKMNTSKGPIYIFSDHLPWQNKFPAGIEWTALGKPLPNTAIITASRAKKSHKDRCMLIIANLSDKAIRTAMKIEFPGSEKKPIIQQLAIAANKQKKVSVNLKSGTGAVAFSLAPDDLNFDNKVILLPEKTRMLRVKVDLDNKKVKSLVSKAILSSGSAAETGIVPQLLISNKDTPKDNINKFIIKTAKKGRAYSGPYTVNRNHPLTNGIDLKGVIWGANLTNPLEGDPLILVGNKPVVTSMRTASGKQKLFFAFNPSLSTLQDTPNWPILFWNLIDWLSDIQPGIHRKNYRSGEKINFKAPSDTKQITIAGPDEKETSFSASGDQLITVDIPGSYSITTDNGKKKKKYTFQVNPLNYDESDISNCTSKVISEQKSIKELLKDYLDISWIFLLLALILLCLHFYLIRRTDK